MICKTCKCSACEIVYCGKSSRCSSVCMRDMDYADRGICMDRNQMVGDPVGFQSASAQTLVCRREDTIRYLKTIRMIDVCAKASKSRGAFRLR